MGTFIKKLKIKRTKLVIAVADFETRIVKNKQEIFAWALIINNKLTIKYLTKINEQPLIESFLQVCGEYTKTQKIVVYFHNLANFDGILLLSQAIKLGYVVIPIIKNNQIFKLTINNIIFLDSYKMIPMSLDQIGFNFLKINKIKIDIVYMSSNIFKYKKIIEKYMIRDVEILYKSMLIFEKEIIELTKGLSITNYISISSLTYDFYKNEFMNENEIFNLNNTDEYINKIIRNSYKGGITEVYKPYGKNLYYYDINSSYPCAMLNYMPIGEPYKLTKKELKNFSLKNFFGFLTVTINVSKTMIPFIGVRTETSTIYSYGEYTTSVFSEELKYAMIVNKIKIIKVKAAVSFKKKKIFTKFIQTLYAKKIKSKDPVRREIYKRFLNHLYGRFGMKHDITMVKLVKNEDLSLYKIMFNIFIISELKENSLIKIDMNIDHNRLFKEIKKTKIVSKHITKHINEIIMRKKTIVSAPQIASATTAYARIQIDKYKRKIIREKGIIYYSDTDSIITDLPPQKLEISLKLLGGLKMEYKIKKAIILAPKTYLTIDYTDNIIFKFKGINHKFLLEHFKQLENIKKLYEKLYENINKKKESSIDVYIPIRKDFNKMQIIANTIVYKPLFKSIKRYKVFKNNKWIDTKSININKIGKKWMSTYCLIAKHSRWPRTNHLQLINSNRIIKRYYFVKNEFNLKHYFKASLINFFWIIFIIIIILLFAVVIDDITDKIIEEAVDIIMANEPGNRLFISKNIYDAYSNFGISENSNHFITEVVLTYDTSLKIKIVTNTINMDIYLFLLIPYF